MKQSTKQSRKTAARKQAQREKLRAAKVPPTRRFEGRERFTPGYLYRESLPTRTRAENGLAEIFDRLF
jgi:hypothetical protein